MRAFWAAGAAAGLIVAAVAVTRTLPGFSAVAPNPALGELVPHRAVYDVRLAESDGGSAFVRADGRFVMEWENVCTGFTLNQRMVTEFVPFEGNAIVSDLRFSSWEAVSGDVLRFTLKNFFNGDLSEEAVGVADRSKGTITFETPDRAPEDLPGKSVFPSELTADVLEAALAGTRVIERVVYDGAEDGAAMDTTAFIGAVRDKANTDEPASPEVGKVLADLESWPVTLSYFGIGSADDLPEYQVSYALYANGVSDELIIDYGDFKLSGTLTELTILDKPEC